MHNSKYVDIAVIIKLLICKSKCPRHTGGGGGPGVRASVTKWHMGGVGSKIGQESVTYYLNGLLLGNWYKPRRRFLRETSGLKKSIYGLHWSSVRDRSQLVLWPSRNSPNMSLYITLLKCGNREPFQRLFYCYNCNWLPE